ncbi:MAG: hypothetical protein N4A35_03825 [Flavobacteriales bacterium]|jgi:hypothetical protein|nr:hypothetical protein [Flavobacteriales bacterium]
MKKLYILVASIMLAASTYAQAPEKMSYQAVVRNSSNTLITNQAVGMQISILQGSTSGSAVYVETQTPSTNINGLVSIEIGTGTVVSGTFNSIDWSAGPYFIKTETDPAGATNYSITGTSQLMSVPYAFHANTAENVTNDLVDDADADPTNEMNTSVVLNGTDLEITDGNGTITTDLSSLAGSGSGNWTLNGTNINNSNAGNVGIGSTAPDHLLEVGSADTNSVVTIGHIGGFNEPYSSELIFEENLDYNGFCGVKFQLNGLSNDLHLIGGCPTPDTIARFNRSGHSNLQSLRIGSDILTNATSTLTVDGDIQVNGNVNITGNIAKGGGTFKIDHPLDPENKYLIHSFVESSEMLNIYSGNITTDANGFAHVQMPEYFEAANKDFRYQLTVIGSFAQAIIKEKVKGNKFVIQTNQPNVEVSWSVTGVRADKYAEKYPIITEKEKELKGSYIHPELFGANKDQSEDNMKLKEINSKLNTNDADRK